MALSNVIRRTASQVVPLAVRSIRRSQSYHHSALFSAVVDRRAVHRNLFRSSVPSTLHLYSTQKRSSSDESLLKVIQSEIQFAEESDEQNKVSFSLFNLLPQFIIFHPIKTLLIFEFLFTVSVNYYIMILLLKEITAEFEEGNATN